MSYKSLQQAVEDLENTGRLIRIKEEVDPYLEMASIQLRAYKEGAPAILFEKVKGSKFKALANLYGTMERCKYLFRDTLPKVQHLMELRGNPMAAFKKPVAGVKSGVAALTALPLKVNAKASDYFEEVQIADLPQIQHWPLDGGAFITLPQVFSENPDQPGVMQGNVGMYRIQLSGGQYEPNREIGLHYQIHRGIGIHQSLAKASNKPLKVSVFVGGPPAHTVAAVMPLPEGISELTFAGLLAGRRFRYFYEDGYVISKEADFVITGEIASDQLKPEGPFGDHLGYYSLSHPFPYLKVHKVFAKKDGIWPFTVVGRPPQEDTSFGDLIHEMTSGAISQEIPGVKAVNAVDEAGVHPLLLAIGSERYTPYQAVAEPQELLTQANRILGTGQLSLAKYLWITDDPSGKLSVRDIPGFFKHILERIDLKRDLHFQTCTTIDTLDYSGTALNKGSKLILAASGAPIRALSDRVAGPLKNALEDPILLQDFPVHLVMPGVIGITMPAAKDEAQANHNLQQLQGILADHKKELQGLPLIVLTEDSHYLAENLSNFLWISFTRSNPAADIYGVESFTHQKHWGTDTAIILDARVKPHHAPALTVNPATEARVDQLLQGYKKYFPTTVK
ncbi:4-hydroxy-3-polyprenylbenzoate decarboxylase [Arachidicoccus rhizosphaerae]|uniref:4-hydroxy-3-polyprenylbenzoate decarboxylase n=1 Tax=Arachidicoccus rhizosphaerae TaxID=551991 RepID=A0A1H3WMT9_9BACT|nr:UbiD family decarboxylase [Arachidicoccus rhizosphaerae]SDZ88439.1 4-hydroxy-3-polyprenylbenzoate decarboxylase [Arachidicoccus rhizosphaerae]